MVSPDSSNWCFFKHWSFLSIDSSPWAGYFHDMARLSGIHGVCDLLRTCSILRSQFTGRLSGRVPRCVATAELGHVYCFVYCPWVVWKGSLYATLISIRLKIPSSVSSTTLVWFITLCYSQMYPLPSPSSPHWLEWNALEHIPTVCNTPTT